MISYESYDKNNRHFYVSLVLIISDDADGDIVSEALYIKHSYAIMQLFHNQLNGSFPFYSALSWFILYFSHLDNLLSHNLAACSKAALHLKLVDGVWRLESISWSSASKAK